MEDDEKNAMSGKMKAAMIAVSVALGLVIAAPILLSSQDLFSWAQSGLGLSRTWAWLVPIALDCAAIVCIGMSIVSVWRGERPGIFGILVWVFAGASAFAQYQHGLSVETNAPDARFAFPAFALLGPLLLEVTMNRLRRWIRQDSGELQRGAAGFGSSWIPGVAFKETCLAWAASRREGISNAADARAYVREVEALKDLSGRDAVLYAYQAMGNTAPYAARVWLQARHVMVAQTDIDDARVETVRRPVVEYDESTAVALMSCKSKRDKIRMIAQLIGSTRPAEVVSALKVYGVTVTPSEVSRTARELPTQTISDNIESEMPALTAE